MKLDTVKIEADTKTGYAIINKEDFNRSKHEIFKPLAAPPKFILDDVEPEPELPPEVAPKKRPGRPPINRKA